jgi:CheY-like chemotaxis protein
MSASLNDIKKDINRQIDHSGNRTAKGAPAPGTPMLQSFADSWSRSTASTRSVGLLVADDHARARLQALLAALPGWRIAFACGSADDAMHRLTDDAPSLLLVDLALPDGGALDLLRHVGRWWPECVAVAVCTDALMADSRDPYRLFRATMALPGTPAVTPVSAYPASS